MTTVSPTAQSSTESRTPAAQKSLAPDLNMFLKMLTTQLQHQDPLSPMDTAQYTQQLVQYSQVEQALQQNGTLKDILGSMTSQSMAQASTLVGKQVQFDGNVAGLSGSTPATWSYTLSQVPATVTATVTDEQGKVVDRVTLKPSAGGTISWDGKTSHGTAPDGAYTLTLKAQTADGLELPATITASGVVKDVVQTNGKVQLGVNGIRLPLSKMIGITSAAS